MIYCCQKGTTWWKKRITKFGQCPKEIDFSYGRSSLMYVNCFPLHFCCLQLVTKAMLLYNSAICDLLRESIQIMKIPIHVKVVKWCRKE